MSALTQAHGDAIYLTCFTVGLVLSGLSFLTGLSHLHLGPLHLGHLRLGRPGGHGHVLPKAGGGGHGHSLSSINGFTIVAFLCWFGGTGYLLTHGRVFPWALSLLFALLSGMTGSGLVMWFFARVLLPRERILEPADTPMIGVLGRVSATVPPNGVGEMLYSQGGARRSVPIAAEDGVGIARSAEVVVLRYARGVAYVRRWDEMQQILLGDLPAAHGAGPDPEAVEE